MAADGGTFQSPVGGSVPAARFFSGTPAASVSHLLFFPPVILEAEKSSLLKAEWECCQHGRAPHTRSVKHGQTLGGSGENS